MDVNYADGSLLALWYDTWLALLAYTVALLVGILTVASTRWHGPGLLLNVVMVLAVLAGLPITMLRVGINLAVSDYEALGYLNLVGTVVALAVGVTYLRRQGFGFRQMLAGPMAESITPTQGLTLQTEVGQSGGPAATMMADATPTPNPNPGEQMLTQAPTAWLHFQSGPMAGQTVPLESGMTSIGRAEDNDVVLEDATASRRHARISYEGGQYFLEDEGSVGGTLVEGAAAIRTLLSSGATLQMGETEIAFMQAEPSAAPGTASGTGMGPQSPAETLVMEMPQQVMAWLAVTAGPQKGKTYQLKAGDNCESDSNSTPSR